MNFPDELRYTKDHEWLRVDGSQATIGITDFAQRELGDIVFVEIEEEGSEIEQNGVFGTVEAVKTVSELYMPVAGKIIEINGELDPRPEVINDDPYGEGWMVKIEIANPSELDELMDAAAYADLVGA